MRTLPFCLAFLAMSTSQAQAKEEVCAEEILGLGVQDRVITEPPEIRQIRDWMRTSDKAPPAMTGSTDRVIQWLGSDHPLPTKKPMAVNVDGVRHPFQEGTKLVQVDARTSLRPAVGDFEKNVTIVIDVSGSMLTVPTRKLPLMEDEALRGRALEPTFRKVDRVTLARESAHALVNSLGANTYVSLVVFNKGKAIKALPHTPIEDIDTIHKAIDEEHPYSIGKSDPFSVAYKVASSRYEPCGDDRVFFFGDNDLNIDRREEEQAAKLIEQWSLRGIQFWMVSVGTRGEPIPKVEKYTKLGHGGIVRVESIGDAKEALHHALRDLGAVVREPTVTTSFTSPWRRVGQTDWQPPGKDVWTLDTTLEGGWRENRLYEVKGGTASASWKASSPVPGLWEQTGSETLSMDGAGHVLQNALAAMWFMKQTQATQDAPEDSALKSAAASLVPKGRWAEGRAWIDRTAFRY